MTVIFFTLIQEEQLDHEVRRTRVAPRPAKLRPMAPSTVIQAPALKSLTRDELRIRSAKDEEKGQLAAAKASLQGCDRLRPGPLQEGTTRRGSSPHGAATHRGCSPHGVATRRGYGQLARASARTRR
ncbi:hypothetical protein B296_00033105 [Ensete ventricosum]|uniref:Uncharacterized protein n=1 Tax=Ensete ventricosum TaxID=4639 RepID=A0A426XBN3_ENSVE|nr:hypothetical protein B296_00033105 [Ensete ventricosum]